MHLQLEQKGQDTPFQRLRPLLVQNYPIPVSDGAQCLLSMITPQVHPFNNLRNPYLVRNNQFLTVSLQFGCIILTL